MSHDAENTGWKFEGLSIRDKLFDGMVGVPYNCVLVATGGWFANIDWPVGHAGRYPKFIGLGLRVGWSGGGNLPPGIAQTTWQGSEGQNPYLEPFSPAYCRLSGTPTVPGTYLLAMVAEAGYGSGIELTRLYVVKIFPAPGGGCPAIALPTSLPDPLILDAPYSRSVEASGGTPPYYYGLVGGILPDGLAIGMTSGFLSGTPYAVLRSTVLVAPVPALTGFTMTLGPGTRARYPDATPFNVLVWPNGESPSASNAEIVRVISWVGDVLTLAAIAGIRVPQGGSTSKAIEVEWAVALAEFPFTVRAVDAAGCMGERLYNVPDGAEPSGIGVCYKLTGSAPALEGPVTFPNELFVRTSGHVGNQGIRLGTELAPEADIVVSMAAGQYVLGSVVPQFGPLTHASAAIRSLAPYTKVVVYVGDGLANRDIGPIHGDGVRSSLALGIPHNGDPRYVRTSLDIGATSTRLSGVGSSTTAITALGENSISVGAALNANGVTYTLLSFSNGLALTGLRSGIIGITWVEFALELP